MKRSVVGLIAAILAASLPASAATWFPRGPYGGDARSFSADPKNSQHIFLGTAIGWLFDSEDGGKSWRRLSRVAKRDDLVLAHVLVDPNNPKHLLVGAYAIDHPDGGFFESQDGGMTWSSNKEMAGQSMRSLAAAPSDPKLLIAGTLLGVYRSTDMGEHWKLISPAGSAELHEIESIAIDPINPQIIYAGTWHLPWKTTDGGTTWTNMKNGIIDDSDVFSIIVDPASPQVVYASACSGIYKSLNAGGKFERVRKDQLGMDHAAIRTRKLQQDPNHAEIVFAGTTQGLWRTGDNSSSWSRITSPEVIVNDVYVDPKNSNHVLLATDRGGVLLSEDGSKTFQPSNMGFSARQVTSFLSDPRHPATVYAGVVNDKSSGGVFVSQDGGLAWQQQSLGLNGTDIFSLAMTQDGTLLAGTQHGMYRMENGAWSLSNAMAEVPAPAPTATVKKTAAVPAKSGKLSSAAFTDAAGGKSLRPSPKKAVATKTVKPALAPPSHVDAVVYAMATDGDAVLAGTSEGLMRGTQDGHVWAPIASLPMPEPRYVAANKNTILVGNLRRMTLSVDGGKAWDALPLPAALTHVTTLAVDELNNLWVGGPEGVFYSADFGLTWKTLQNLYMTRVSGIYFDPVEHRVMVTALNSTLIFAAHLPDYKVNYWESGWNLRFVRPVGDHLVGVTMYDGVVVQPKMVDSPIAEVK